MADKDVKDYCKTCSVEPPAMRFKCPECEHNPDKEQIIIDGVDVSGCVSFDKLNGQNICCYEDTREDKIPFANFCVENKDCYFKQLARKTQECKELKRLMAKQKNAKIQLSKLKDKQYKEFCDMKQTLTEIKEIAEPFCNACQEFEPEKKGSNCMYCNYGKILNIINKAKDGE